MAEKRIRDYTKLEGEELVKLMAGPFPIVRKNSAKALLAKVKESPEYYVKYIPEIIDALDRPEAQTRWECLDTLTILVSFDAKACKAAIEGAEEALFDEKTSLIRENAMRFLCRYGAGSKKRSIEVWSLIKEALQEFHGEIDYDKILNRVNYFACGSLDDNVKKDLRAVTKEIMASVGGPTKARLDRILKSTMKRTPAQKKSTSVKKSSKDKDKNSKNTAKKGSKSKKATKTSKSKK